MKEIRMILSTYEQKQETEKVALATVVRVEGSSYRRMGARMLVSENGTWVGGISGGCLEGDALKRARMAILKDKASVITYDTTTDDNHQIGVGLGCNGIIDVLFKPINTSLQTNAISVLEKTTKSPRKIRKLITITQCSDRGLLGDLFEFSGFESLQQIKEYCDTQKLADFIEVLEKSKNLMVNEGLTVFVEILPPQLHLILLGHQYDLYPLIRQTQELGWDITVVAPSTKVKAIKGVTLVSPEEKDSLIYDEYTAVILMSHSLQTDKENLKTLIKEPINYIGMLGPKVRSERIFNELGEDSICISETVKRNIYAPTGLDIGATNPEEIALSILAEIKTVFSQRSGSNLRERQSPIHSREQTKNFN